MDREKHDQFVNMLVGDFPNETSVTPQVGESSPRNVLPELGRVPIDENKLSYSTKNSSFCDSSRATKHGSYAGLTLTENPDSYLQSYSELGISHSCHEPLDPDGPNLADNQSLASAFKGLSCKDGMSVVPNSYSSSCLSYGTYGMMDDSNLLELNLNKLMKQTPESLSVNHVKQWPNFPTYSEAMPMNPGAQSFQFHNVPAWDLEVADFNFHQQYYLNAQSPAYMTPKHSIQSNIEGRYQKTLQEYMHLQNIQNQMRALHQFQKGMHASSPTSIRSTLQSNLEMLISPQAGQFIQDYYWKNNIEEYNSLDHSLMSVGRSDFSQCCMCGKGENCIVTHDQKPCQTSFATNFIGYDLVEKTSRGIVPENFLTKSRRMDSLSSSSTGHQSSYYADNSRRIFSKGNIHNSVLLGGESFHLSCQNSRALLPDNSDYAHASKSLLLKYDSLDEVTGRICRLAKDQHGCRFLQKCLDGCPEVVDKIFSEVINHVVELMTNAFGNYLVQKLLEVGSADQRTNILRAITRGEGDLIRISCNEHGTRAVQKMIKILKVNEQSMIVSSLKPGMVTLMKDTHGTHVAQCCLHHLSPENQELLFIAIIDHFVELATDRQGCCVLQKCLKQLNGELCRQLMSKITSKALTLSQDKFGNYVVQCLLCQNVPWATAAILNQLEGHHGSLSIQKYSSNVVEKCLKHVQEVQCDKIISELINNPQLHQISQDQFGNYVIQTALKESKGALHAALVGAIMPYVPTLRNSPFGRKVTLEIGLKK